MSFAFNKQTVVWSINRHKIDNPTMSKIPSICKIKVLFYQTPIESQQTGMVHKIVWADYFPVILSAD